MHGVGSNARRLRSGFTTGACAAAAAKAATLLLLEAHSSLSGPAPAGGEDIAIPFPDGSRHAFRIQQSGCRMQDGNISASASVIKDAGDDPDVTNGAEIAAEARFIDAPPCRDGDREHGAAIGDIPGVSCALVLRGGHGVGRVTKPGLPVPVGEPAINPIPRKMIREAVGEALQSDLTRKDLCLEITITVPQGEALAKKTLNARLGILGGISILGTSGIVKPLSTEAWTCSIAAALNVAEATGCTEVVLSVGRVSERAHMHRYHFQEEAYIMMGDYFAYTLAEARKHAFRKIHISAHWAKMLKISLATPQTHVRHGALDIRKGVEHLNSLGIAVPEDRDFNTAREVYDFLISQYGPSLPMLRKVCLSAKQYAEGLTGGVPVVTHLVRYEGDIITDSD